MDLTTKTDRKPGEEHVTFDPDRGLSCTCGWTYHKAARKKVFIAALEKHQRRNPGHVWKDNA